MKIILKLILIVSLLFIGYIQAITRLTISEPSSSTKTFGDAVQYCESLSQDNNNDWFLPEMEDLVMYAGDNDNTVYWTRSPALIDHQIYYGSLNLHTGYAEKSLPTETFKVRCMTSPTATPSE